MSEAIGLLERTWFKCRTCGIDCSNEVLATWHNPYSDQVESWGQCTTCAMLCENCDEPVEPDSQGIGHAKHDGCWAVYCEAGGAWKEACPDCGECPSCEHCNDCNECWYGCNC